MTGAITEAITAFTELREAQKIYMTFKNEGIKEREYYGKKVGEAAIKCDEALAELKAFKAGVPKIDDIEVAMNTLDGQLQIELMHERVSEGIAE